MKLICTDTETGGLDPHKHSLLSVAFCVVDTDTYTISNEINQRGPPHTNGGGHEG